MNSLTLTETGFAETVPAYVWAATALVAVVLSLPSIALAYLIAVGFIPYGG